MKGLLKIQAKFAFANARFVEMACVRYGPSNQAIVKRRKRITKADPFFPVMTTVESHRGQMGQYAATAHLL